MKMLGFLARGQLTNGVTYFLTFADVEKNSLTKIGTFGCNLTHGSHGNIATVLQWSSC